MYGIKNEEYDKSLGPENFLVITYVIMFILPLNNYYIFIIYHYITCITLHNLSL